VFGVYQRSADETAALLARYAEQEPRLLVEAGERYHVSYAQNASVTAALGSRLLFCDADDVMQPGWVAAMAAGLDELEVVSGQTDTNALNSPAVAGRGELPALQRSPEFLPHAASCNLGVRRELFDRLGRFSEGRRRWRIRISRSARSWTVERRLGLWRMRCWSTDTVSDSARLWLRRAVTRGARCDCGRATGSGRCRG